ncbi:MAG TPA: hypothetical protein VML75_13420 [Kofleriaceae bacterium]|nr:hypothetical protein [Kofleriaceae bacterium]
MRKTILLLALGLATASCSLKVGGKTLSPGKSSGDSKESASSGSSESSESSGSSADAPRAADQGAEAQPQGETGAERRARESREADLRRQGLDPESIARNAKLDDSEIVVVEADPGRAKAKPMAPSWCKVADDKEGWTGGRLNRYLKNAIGGVWTPDAIGEVGGGLCRNPSDANWQKQTGYFMQVWMNWTGMTQQQVTESVTLRVQAGRWKAQREETCKPFATGSESSELEKLEAAAMKQIFGCRDGIASWRQRPANDKRLAWYFDRSAAPSSELLRLHRVFSCLPDPWNGKGAGDTYALARYAVCGVDARRLDQKALERELAAGKFNDYAKTVAREAFSRAQLEAAEYDRVAKQAASKDAAYQTLLYDAPEAAWKAWDKEAANHKRTIDAALAFDAKAYGPSRKAAQGCIPALRSGFRAYVSGGKIKTEEDAKKRAAEPIGAALLGRLMICEAMEGNFNTAAMLADIYKSGRQAQGPRYAVYYAVVAALGEISDDRAKFPIQANMFEYLDWGPHLDKTYEEASHAKKKSGNNGGSVSYSSFMSDAKGTISGLKKQGDTVVVSFKTEKWKEEQFNCKNTKQVWRIESSGEVKYHQECWSTGWKTMTHTERPIIIPADTADGLSAGMFLMGKADYPFTNDKNQQRLGYPTAVYDSAAKKKLVSWYGIKL